MTESKQDAWAEWLLHRRHGDDPERLKAMLAELFTIRDHLLEEAHVGAGEVLLDVRAGDGLIAFGALDRVSPQGKVIFSDISADLLAHSRDLADQLHMPDRCEFVRASADDLSMVADASVDVVTTRSVLIYVKAKLQAFREFFRILKPKGRLAIFEPINSMANDRSEQAINRYWGQDMTPVMDLLKRVQAIYARYQDPESDPMFDFDERDLLIAAEAAGFAQIHLEYHASVFPRPGKDWDPYYRTSGNPKIPTMEEAIRDALTPAEADVLVVYLRPLVERGGGTMRGASAYLWAIK